MSNHSTPSPVNEQISSEQQIKMYATSWCGDCRMAKRWFDSHGISYEYINIEEDDAAADYVVQVNRGRRSVPTIVFPDGSVLVEPSPRELAAKFSA
jgi:mycoredoxin